MNLEKLGLEGFPFDKPLLDEKSEHDLAIRKKRRLLQKKLCLLGIPPRVRRGVSVNVYITYISSKKHPIQRVSSVNYCISHKVFLVTAPVRHPTMDFLSTHCSSKKLTVMPMDSMPIPASSCVSSDDVDHHQSRGMGSSVFHQLPVISYVTHP